ncbi:MAG: DUF4340 domain-containing protein [Thermodesulfobacteriota bacterium]|nr:DUF4340 domain-containing protein [Thermodesulfobacteriota bacterium]
MKTKKTLISIIIMAVLFLMFIIQRQARETTTVKNLPVIVSFDEDEVTSIEIEGKDHIIFIKDEDGIWMLRKPVHYPANQIYFKNLINTIQDLKITDLISENASSYEDFGLTVEKGTKVRVFTGKEKVLEFLLGNTNIGYTHTFIKLYSHPNIYQVRGNIGHIFNREVRYFRDKKIFDVSPNEIIRISIKREKDSIILNREEKEEEGEVITDTAQVQPEEMFVWVEESTGKFVEKDKITTILDGIKGLSAQDFIDNPGEEQRIKKPDFILTVETASRKNVLKVKKKKEKNQFFVEKEGKIDTLFLVPSYQINRINQSRLSLNL